MNNVYTVLFSGLPCSGKTTLCKRLKPILENHLGSPVAHLDGDVLRKGLCSDLKFLPKDRMENIRRVSYVSQLLNDLGMTVLNSFVSPSKASRDLARGIVSNFKMVYVDCPVEVCAKRDVKGMYKLAQQGVISDFTGVNSQFEVPDKNELNTDSLTVNTDTYTIEDCIDSIIKWLNID